MSELSSTEADVFTSALNSTSLDDEIICLSQENNAVRTAGIVVSVIAILENSFLLIAMIIYWSKFLSNLYRFVASLICADLMVALFSICMNVLKFYNSPAILIAFIKGGYATMHMASTFSVSLVNASVFFTYSRFTTRLLEQQLKNMENKHESRIRKYFRKPIAAYITISGVWVIGVVYLVLSMLTRCTPEEHNCLETCSTIVRRPMFPGESSACDSQHCNKFLSPLSSYYTLSVIIMFWVSFIFLIGSTLTVVFVKVKVKMIGGSIDNSGFQNDEMKVENVSNAGELTSEVEGADPGEHLEEIPNIIKETESDEPDITTVTKSKIPSRRKSTHYTIERRFGFNRDLMSRFSLLITITQLIFWMPVTGLILYTLFQNQAFSTFYIYEIIMVYFSLPTILNPWICLLTMSKLRDAIFSMYYSICH
uniref:uncharacterized protein LOC120340994 isoform X1 n=1 Tax=Styela clava TaxID=7725 RepID=UPI0019393D18|nr:uncharacterized protein LOC120340994 isoform X1 [Styela clava]